MTGIKLMSAGLAAMNSLEISALVEKRHDNVKRTIETLLEKRVITSPQIEEKPTAGRPVTVYVFSGELGKRDSLIVVAQLSPKFTARLVDRWQELEKAVATPALPRTYKEALHHLLAQVEENERLSHENESMGKELVLTRPKAVLMDRLVGTSEQLYGINEAGRILGTSGAVMASYLEVLGGVFVKRKYNTTPRQMLKQFIDRDLGRNTTSEVGGHVQAKLTFKGLCFTALLLIRRGVIEASAITDESCRDHVISEIERPT